MTSFSIALVLYFSIGYIAIILEKFLNLNKSATAILMAAGCWLLYFIPHLGETPIHDIMNEPVSEVAQIIFFLMAVMAIVELIDSHNGFKLITDLLHTTSKRKMLWLILVISFFMSSILDNLTSMIVMISLLRKLIPDKEDRWFMGAVVVIAVNAGGAWTPIGDVTTTMLWINHRITTWETIRMLFLPSVVCAFLSGLIASFYIKGKDKIPEVPHARMEPGAKRLLLGGVLALIMIPVWKALFNLPPFMGAFIGLGALWVVADFTHFRHKEERGHLRMPHILGKIDFSGIYFFTGILFAVSALSTAGLLKELALFLEKVFPNQNVVAILIGLISSVIDNVPLVAATFGMYDLAQFPIDSTLWQLIAYAAGTGGSILIIGSAAGVAFMGLEHVDFFWYLRRISWIALIGYFAGAATYLLLHPLFR